MGKKNGDGPLPQNFSSLHKLVSGSLKSLSWTRPEGLGRDSPAGETTVARSSRASSRPVSSRESTVKPRLRRKASLFRTL